MEDVGKEVNRTRTEPTEVKKPYTRPILTVHGNVEDITQLFGRESPFQPPIRIFS